MINAFYIKEFLLEKTFQAPGVKEALCVTCFNQVLLLATFGSLQVKSALEHLGKLQTEGQLIKWTSTFIKGPVAQNDIIASAVTCLY